MKIEFNEREAANILFSLVLGAIGMGVGLTLGPISRLQRERDEARASEERVGLQMGQAYRELQSVKAQCYKATAAQAPPADPTVQILNMVRPGLGTALGTIAQKSQDKKQALAAQQQAAVEPQCPAGTTAETSENWQGLRCVADEPQGTVIQ